MKAKDRCSDSFYLNLKKSGVSIIGEFKKAHNIAIVQAARWDEILSDMIAKGKTYGLPEDFVTAVFTAIHEASIAAQNRILEG